VSVIPSFSKLIAPFPLERFQKEYWEQKPLYVDGKGSRDFEDVLKVDDLSAFLGRSDIRHPSLRLVRNGSEIPLENYTRELRLAAHVSYDLIDNEKLFVHFYEGATIVLQFLQQNIPTFGHFTNELEDLFGCNVHGSCFITPPSAQGFTAHYDTYSFFVLQLFGTKEWNIYGRTPLPPTREDRDVDETWTSGPATQQLVLKAGDFLYVPRGYFHDAQTSKEPSIHLTLGFFAPNWIDIIKSALAELYDDEMLRRTPVFGKGNQDFAGEASSIKGLLIDRLDLRKGLELLQSEYFDRRVDVRTDRLRDALFLQRLSSETVLRLQAGLPYRLTQSNTGQRVELSFARKKLSYPIIVEDALRLMIESQEFTVRSLSSKMSESSLLLLCEQLLREGFLTLSS